MPSSSQEFIELRSVGTNNLKNIDVDFPLGRLTVVTGVSGSGKSSLVFDTLYAESYRRYVESLSSFARQYLKALPKPQIREVHHLPPAIAVRQSRAGTNNRSTVGTLTELYDVLRILFTHLSEIHCRNCGRIVEKDNGETIARKSYAELAGDSVLVLAPLKGWSGMQVKDLKLQLEAQGFSRILEAGKVVKIAEAKFKKPEEACVVLDRMVLDVERRSRLVDSGQLALKVGRGRTEIRSDSGRSLEFSNTLDCCGITYTAPTMGLFSFNHPLGACEECQGFGFSPTLDWAKIIPDKSLSLGDQGVVCWNFGEHVEYYGLALKSAAALRLNLKKKPFAEYQPEEWRWLKEGDGKAFDGITGYFRWLETKRYKAHYRIHAARFRAYVLCTTCNGARLNARALACRLGGQNIAQVCDITLAALSSWLYSLGLKSDDPMSGRDQDKLQLGVREAYEEAHARLSYLSKIGVGYLTLSRSAKTLSGGEMQRINMARCLGSALTDTLFCLDEPTVGLHARDSRNLLEIMYNMRDQGNTVVVVEHEPTIISGADHFIEIGPDAGHQGGYVVHAGSVRPAKEVAAFRSQRSCGEFITLSDAFTHNLQHVNVRFPTGAVTCVCGVSGSGKTSLVQYTLYPLLAQVLGQNTDKDNPDRAKAGGVGPLPIIQNHAEVMQVSQSALGRSSRSNIATYLGVMDEIRKLLAATEESKLRKLMPGSFSFNTAGGRCETCSGMGTVVEDLSFLGEMAVTCPTCQGKRFKDEVLAITWRGKNLTEILDLTVSEARTFFYDRPQMVKTLDTVMGMGLGYVTLGQSTSSFSGGEAQRLKLVEIVRDASSGKPSILIFDEPSTGLSEKDVLSLTMQLHKLADLGHTIIVVEHNLSILRSCDWLIEIGPEAGDRGGQLLYEGPPQGIHAVRSSPTAEFM